jgi:fructose-1,6-bisphosphatase I
MSITVNKLVTIERHITEQEGSHPEATGEFSRLMRDLTLAIRIITRDVRRAGLNDVLGITEDQNVHGERVKKLDTYANDVIFRAMDHGGHLCAMASEESEGIIRIPDNYKRGKYVLLFDPLDGSSNIDVNVSIGTIFSIYKRAGADDGSHGTVADLIQAGAKQVAAGYALYGSSTVLVYTAGMGTDMFTYDPTIGEFLLSNEKIQIPHRGAQYSINEGNSAYWSAELRRYVEWLKTPSDDGTRPYGLRYIGTAVADVHRLLHYGGIFMYPSDSKSPNGKLRLMYEVNPLGMIIEQAGGKCSTGTGRVLDVVPTDIHERSPVYMGSTYDVDMLERFLRGEAAE